MRKSLAAVPPYVKDMLDDSPYPGPDFLSTSVLFSGPLRLFFFEASHRGVCDWNSYYSACFFFFLG